MLMPRIIPCLLLRERGLVKTVRFGDARYVGDPINAVRIFNEKEADELMILDIDATQARRSPDFDAIAHFGAECQMPLCYGGGVKTPQDVEKIIRLGVEKVAISTAAIETPETVSRAAETVGRQSVVVVMDIKKCRSGDRYEVWTRNGTRNTGRTAMGVAAEMQERGAGEIVANSIDHDGLMTGYDWQLAEELHRTVSVPLTILGGAGSYDDLARLVRRYGTIGAAAGSLFVFKGALKAVLINYPSRAQREDFVAAGR